MERLVKGIWIPIEIWQDSNLSWNEKILLMEIDSFTSKDLDCFFSDDYISLLLGVHKTNANKILSSLISKGYVEKTRFDGRRRFIKSLIELPKQGWQNHQGRDDENTGHNNIDEQINIDRENKRSRTFAKPSVPEVAEYCRSRNNGIDAEEFVAFYESKGWMVGKTKMKDWKSAVITWEKARNKQQAYRPQKKESVLEHNLKVYDEMFGTDLHQQAYGKKEACDEQ